MKRDLNRYTLSIIGFMICLLSAALMGVPGMSADSKAEKGRRVLKTRSYWRCFTVLRDPVTGIGKEERRPVPSDRFSRTINSPMPSEGWEDVDFDDQGWMRIRGPFYFKRTSSQPGGYGFHIPRQVAMLFLRGKFYVNDPASAGEMNLSASYRGGIVVYLNGREVARANLPEGKITPETLAEDYPLKAYVSPDGAAIRGGFREPYKYADRLKLRVRSINNVSIPASYLRRGENVLAIEIRGTAFRSDVPKMSSHRRKWAPFNTCGLNGIRLSCANGAALGAPAAAERDVRIWNASVLQGINQSDMGEPGAEIRPIRLTGAANGSYSGQVVLSGGKPLKGVSAAVGDLKLEKGDAVIPASALKIRYAHADWRVSRKGPLGFDSLHPAPPKGRSEKVQPVWLTVHVPPGTLPGTYRGEMQVKVAGTAGWKVPLQMRVVDWKLPDPHAYTTFVDFIESPETVAMQYKVPLWSDEHVAKLKTVFEQLGRVGNKTLYVPLIRRHNLGNAESMVRWIPGKKKGVYDHDFTPLEKYIDVCIAGAGKPKLVVLIVWDGFVSGRTWGGKVTDAEVPVSLLDPETGKVTEGIGPKYSDVEAAKAFWRPVAEGVRKRLVERGMEETLCLGISFDVRTSKETLRVWNKILPGIKWFHQGHGKTTKGMRYSSTVWQAKGPSDPSRKRYHSWRHSPGYVCVSNDRDIWKYSYEYQLVRSRNIGEWNLCGRQQGFGRMCADFWPVLRSKRRGRWSTGGSLSARYPESSWAQLNLRQKPYLSAGRDGAESTARFEAMVEGLQECEARIFIDRALLNKKLRAELGNDLAKRARALLDERVRWLRAITWTRDSGNEFYSVALSSWERLSEELYDMASEIAAKIEKQAER